MAKKKYRENVSKYKTKFYDKITNERIRKYLGLFLKQEKTKNYNCNEIYSTVIKIIIINLMAKLHCQMALKTSIQITKYIEIY